MVAGVTQGEGCSSRTPMRIPSKGRIGSPVTTRVNLRTLRVVIPKSSTDNIAAARGTYVLKVQYRLDVSR